MATIVGDFKKLSVEDRVLIKQITNRYRPYSDFNFSSLFAWDIDDNTFYCRVPRGLVVNFQDYIDKHSVISIIGSRNCDDLVKEILDSPLYEEIQFVPEVIAKKFQNKKDYVVSEDADQHDYIYDAREHSHLKGRKFSWHRRKINKFLKNTVDDTVETRFIDLRKYNQQVKYVNSYHVWQKASDEIPEERYAQERKAIERYLKNIDKLTSQYALGVYINKVLSGIVMFEIDGPNRKYFTVHFMKVNYEHEGIFNYLFFQLAQRADEVGIKYINFEQDLGIQGLRTFKTLLKPCEMLKKYTISKR